MSISAPPTSPGKMKAKMNKQLAPLQKGMKEAAEMASSATIRHNPQGVPVQNLEICRLYPNLLVILKIFKGGIII